MTEIDMLRATIRRRNDRMVAGRAALAILVISLAMWALLIKGGLWLLS